jgi:hypothetical protein
MSSGLRAQDASSSLPIQDLLRDNGSLDLYGTLGSINLDGWQMSMPESGPPIISKGSDMAAPGDEYWEDGFESAEGTNGEVWAVVSDGKGNLYVGGNSTEAGGVSANYIAKWDGSRWSALGDGLDGAVRALVVDGSGNLYAGGDFNNSGGPELNHVAKWDGSKWRGRVGQWRGEMERIGMECRRRISTCIWRTPAPVPALKSHRTTGKR